jgi:lipopolysaccharide/colanic/teichoic acid biosynthesis glycosyltransferase
MAEFTSPVVADASMPARWGDHESSSQIPGLTRPPYLHAKRATDVIVAALLLLALAPVLALIALLILIDSGRPIFFVQRRVSARPTRVTAGFRWTQCTFPMVKFRTMTAGADQSPLHEEFVRAFVSGTTPHSESAPAKLSDDPRVTRMGRILRATSLDELPQLVNVIAGSMSLVGPRPVPLYEVAAYETRHRERLAARPGITGAWQLDGRGRVSFEQMIRMDVEYVRRQSLREDLRILVKTLPAVVSRRGAR